MRTIGVVAGLACLIVACAPRAPDTAPTFPAQRRPSHGMPLPRPAAEVARLVERERFEIRVMEAATGGVTHVDHARAYFPAGGVELPIKWKVAPSGGEGWNNVPRKEVAAFVIQQWFLDSRDWIVPPTAIRCIPVDEHRRFRDVDPVVDDTRCVLGMVAAWLDGVRNPDAILEANRFENEPEYARHRADMNLVAYLIDHRDGRLSNFLVPKEDDGRIYLVDNGIAFGGLIWNYFRPTWNVIRMPLQRSDIDRLRRVTAADVDALLVVAQLEADARGVLEPVSREAAWDASEGARLRRGRAQFGLTAAEVAGVAARLQRLLARVDDGEIALF
jgi:hypothetical protein